MSKEAHDFFQAKVEKADSLDRIVVTLEKRVSSLQDSLTKEQHDFVRILLESDRIRAELEQARFSLKLEVEEMERQLKLLKLTHRQRRAMLRKYYPKLTRQDRKQLIGAGILAGSLSIFLGVLLR